MGVRRKRALNLLVVMILGAAACEARQLLGPVPEVPPVDDQALATMIVGTARALASQTARAAPTAGATATATAAATATRVVIPPTATESTANSTLTIRDNGSTLFIDEAGGYQLVVPPGWLAVRINESEYFGALERLGDAEPAVQKAIASILSEDPAIMRLFAFDLQPDHIQGGVVSSITVQWNENDAMSLASDADLQAEAERLRGMIPGAEILDVKVEITPGGIQHGLLSARWPATTATGSVVLFQKQAFLKFGPGRLVVTLVTTDALRDTLAPGFDEMIREVELVAPQ